MEALNELRAELRIQVLLTKTRSSVRTRNMVLLEDFNELAPFMFGRCALYSFMLSVVFLKQLAAVLRFA